MTNDSDVRTDDSLLRQTAALRALAASLVGGGHDAEDLAQEAWLRGARASNGTRSWFGAVLRNLVRDRARERGRRAWTERAAARDEALPSGDEIVARLEIARRVADEVARLDEPYRTAIHLRYFEGLSPAEIAVRGAWPLETVRTRLKRGLALLRERLDRTHGGERERWLLALAPLAMRWPATTTAAAGASLAVIGGTLMSTKIVAACAAVLVVTLGVVLWQRSEAAGPADDSSVVAGAPEFVEPVEHAAAPDATRSEVVVAGPGAGVIAAPATALLEVHGTVVVVDPEGGEHRNESGKLTLAFGTGETAFQTRTITFDSGAWQARIPAGGMLVFAAVVAGGRSVVLKEAAPITPGSAPIEVRGQWLAVGRLKVVDARTKLDLRGIEVRTRSRGWRVNPEWTHPGDHPSIETVLRDALSPFDLPQGRVWATYWIHAPGYAWAKVDFDHRVGGQRTVELVEPASLEAHVEGALPDGAFVRLYSADEVEEVRDVAGHVIARRRLTLAGGRVESWLARASMRANPGGATRIEDLQPGRYVACVETGEHEETRRLGEAPIELAAGDAAHVTIAIDATLAATPHSHVFGTLVPPEGADVSSWSLMLSQLDANAKPITLKVREMSTTSRDHRTLHWDAGQLAAGEWLACVRPIEHRVPIHAQADVDTEVAIELPSLVAVTVEVVDAKSGLALMPTRLGWSDGDLEGVSQTSIANMVLDSDSRTWHFATVEGPIAVNCSIDGFEPRWERLDLRGPSATLRLAMTRACGVRLQFFEGDSLQPVEYDFLSSVRCVRTGERAPVGRPGGDGGTDYTVLVPQPGRYTLRFPTLAGFEQVEPLEVDVPADTIVDVRVALRRE